MRRVRIFLRLDASERRLVIRCACVLVAMRLGARLMPVRRLHALVARRARGRGGQASRSHHSAERIAWAVRAAALVIPGATCLPRALTAWMMLRRHGHPAQLRIGIARADGNSFAGHAWVESDGEIVLGGENGLRYTPMHVVEEQPVAVRGPRGSV